MAEPQETPLGRDNGKSFVKIVTCRGPVGCPDPEAWRTEIPLVEALGNAVLRGAPPMIAAWAEALLMSGEVSTNEAARRQIGEE